LTAQPGGGGAGGARERLAGQRGGEEDRDRGELDDERGGGGSVHAETERGATPVIRRCVAEDVPAIAEIVNAAAVAYRGVIPADRWHEPYMPRVEVEAEIAAGVEFWGFDDGRLVGVMGVQPVRDVVLIRHAYVLPDTQGRGIGSALLSALTERVSAQLLVGTWAAATWAIGFYERHGFVPVARERVPDLLRRYWSIPERQVETSVVLARPAL
jgi:GNAT superfamily N-acetyltransferase